MEVLCDEYMLLSCIDSEVLIISKVLINLV